MAVFVFEWCASIVLDGNISRRTARDRTVSARALRVCFHVDLINSHGEIDGESVAIDCHPCINMYYNVKLKLFTYSEAQAGMLTGRCHCETRSLSAVALPVPVITPTRVCTLAVH